MGLFNNDKNKEEITELVVKTENNSNDIIAVKRDADKFKNEFELYKVENDERLKSILEELANMKEIYNKKINVLENEKEKLIKEYEQNIESQKSDGKYMTCDDVCRKLDITNLKTSPLKFYLYENGIMKMSINKERNSFSVNTENINNANREILDCIVIDNNKIMFKDEFITYGEKYKHEILNSIERYENKQEQYKASKRNLESRNVTNYKEEIKMICGTDSNEKWIAIYKIFSNTYKTFYADYEKYKKEHPIKGSKYDISKVAYIVSIMGEGNYLLKIACDLYA